MTLLTQVRKERYHDCEPLDNGFIQGHNSGMLSPDREDTHVHLDLLNYFRLIDNQNEQHSYLGMCYGIPFMNSNCSSDQTRFWNPIIVTGTVVSSPEVS